MRTLCRECVCYALFFSLTVVSSGCAKAIGPVSSNSAEKVSGTECFTRAANAAVRAYKKYFKADWILQMESIVDDIEIEAVSVRVGPYDGSAGGGIVAKFSCDQDSLVTVASER
jgi:hypothetical protein